MKIHTETWNKHKIRFIEVKPSEWWAIAKDVSEALGYNHTPHMTRRLDDEEKADVLLTDARSKNGVKQARSFTIISEVGIYEAIFGSELKEAKQFKKWVYSIIKKLRQDMGLNQHQVTALMNTEHQKAAMERLEQSLQSNKPINYIKANTIANKAISTKYGHPKMVKKKDMTPDMLIERQTVLDATVNLMSLANEFNLDISVSAKIYEKYAN